MTLSGRDPQTAGKWIESMARTPIAFENNSKGKWERLQNAVEGGLLSVEPFERGRDRYILYFGDRPRLYGAYRNIKAYFAEHILRPLPAVELASEGTGFKGRTFSVRGEQGIRQQHFNAMTLPTKVGQSLHSWHEALGLQLVRPETTEIEAIARKNLCGRG